MVNSIISSFLLVIGLSFAGAASPGLGDCTAICKETRQGILADIDKCKPALKHHPVPKIFNACIEGRKRAFDQACIPICLQSAEVTVSSFEGCEVTKKQGHRFLEWCRKGYDGILQNLEENLPSITDTGNEDDTVNDEDPMRTTGSRAYWENGPVKSESAAQKPGRSKPGNYGVKSKSAKRSMEKEPIQLVQNKPGVKGETDHAMGKEHDKKSLEDGAVGHMEKELIQPVQSEPGDKGETQNPIGKEHDKKPLEDMAVGHVKEQRRASKAQEEESQGDEDEFNDKEALESEL